MILMELHFLGGAQEVGRSAILMKGFDDESSMLFDYGVKLADGTEYPMPASKIAAYFLSHAHLDHSGFAPALYEKSLPPAFGTAPTLELSKLLIEDSIKICRKRRETPKISKSDLRKFQRAYVAYDYGAEIEVNDYIATA